MNTFLSLKPILSIVISTAFFVQAQAQAQTTVAEDDTLLKLSIEELMEVDVVSIATGVQQSVTRAPAVTSVITSEDIKAIGATDLDEVLETVPGLHVARSPLHYAPIYTMRGIYSDYNSQMLILVNGIPINTLFIGGKNRVWGGMPVNSIARIEIIRGPGSAMFGADAFAGVINIITKGVDSIETPEVGLRAGHFDTQEAWALYKNKWKDYQLAFTMEYRRTDGQREVIDADVQTYYDKLFGTHASLAPGPVNLPVRNFDTHLEVSKGHWQWRAGYQGHRNIGTGAGIGLALDPITRYTSDTLNTDLTYHHPEFSKDWDVTAQISFLDIQWTSLGSIILYPPGAFGGSYPEGFLGNSAVSERNSRIEVSGFYSGVKDHLIRLGMGYHYGDLYDVLHMANFGTDPKTGLTLPPGSPLMDFSDTPSSFLPKKTRKNWHAFLQDTWTVSPDWELTAGIRYDDYSDFGSTVNPRFALVWKTLSDLTTKFLYGKAFRAPSFVELYGANNPVALGNPNLGPETMDNFEVVFDYQISKNLRLVTNAFTYRWEDAILPQADAGATFTARNAGSQKAHGLEWEVSWKPLTNLNVAGSYSFQKALDVNRDHDPGNVPRHHVNLRTAWQYLPQWHFNTQVNWVAGRERTSGDTRPAVKDYTTVDILWRRQSLKGNWDLSFVMRNLFDADAREPSPGPDVNGILAIPNDLPLAGRNYFVEMSYRF